MADASKLIVTGQGIQKLHESRMCFLEELGHVQFSGNMIQSEGILSKTGGGSLMVSFAEIPVQGKLSLYDAGSLEEVII